MTTTLLEQYAHALAELGSRVDLVEDRQWSDPTPCTEWDVRTLVSHVVDEARRAPYLLSGGTVAAAGDRRAPQPGRRSRRRGRWTAPSRCPPARWAPGTTCGR